MYANVAMVQDNLLCFAAEKTCEKNESEEDEFCIKNFASRKSNSGTSFPHPFPTSGALHSCSSVEIQMW
jgi:hypothetical protein